MRALGRRGVAVVARHGARHADGAVVAFQPAKVRRGRARRVGDLLVQAVSLETKSSPSLSSHISAILREDRLALGLALRKITYLLWFLTAGLLKTCKTGCRAV